MRAINVEEVAAELGITNVAALKDVLTSAGVAGIAEAYKIAAYEEAAAKLGAASHRPIGFTS